MPYGSLSPEQEAAIRPYVEGKNVHDFGAGDFSLSYQLLDLGAKHVTAIDKEERPLGRTPKDKRITSFYGYFHEYPAPVDVLFLSWPVNYPDISLAVHARRAGTLIYLGKNTDGTACGSTDLFNAMIYRELLTYVPHRKNALIITGRFDDCLKAREPTGEERAAMTSSRKMWTYEESEGR